MTLNVDDKKTLSDIRFAKAREALADARATLADERFVDYGDFESTSRSEAEDSVQRADRLLNQIDTVRTRLATQL